ncbi:MAG: glycine--tRNA ligase subunit beta [Gammaproteobacteria bacterium]|jgi:glycyl-tRNA synthetase beta chain|nr:glycine--tRNA ligase subunit beta [Gammaproteobacteria bacterium]
MSADATNREDFLVELGTEELPPKSLLQLSEALTAGLVAGLESAQLAHGEIRSFATPRRLAVLVEALATEQPEQVLENRGPPVKLAYDAQGMPTQAATAFAAKCGVTVEQLSTTSGAKGEWLFYRGTRPGKRAVELLPALVEQALAALPISRRMRWGSGTAEFVRPVHWLVMLLGDSVVPAEILDVAAGRSTRGHRFHHPGPIELAVPAEYVHRLENPGHVIADFATRRRLVIAGAESAAAELGGTALLEADVVDEVTALVEWPVPVTGHFSEDFLQLPAEVLISTLQDHQRYFPVTGPNGLMPAFITTSNLLSRDPAAVQRGNERVVTPRLADAAFFWQQDCGRTLADRVQQLDSVVYQKGLGSLADKSMRMGVLAASVATTLGAEPAATARAAELARADLLTAMVGEFPELQGRMGYYYALHDNEPERVARALEEQYLPRHAGDRLPEQAEGLALALADRLDTLAGVFALGKKPSGNKDPYGLRRQALGLVRILVERQIEVDLPKLLAQAVDLQPVQQAGTENLCSELYEFVIERMRAWYLDGLAPGLERGSVTAEMFQAVASRNPASPLDFDARLKALQAFMQDSAAASLAAANKRIANILRKNSGLPAQAIDAGVFETAAERALEASVARLREAQQVALAGRNYAAALAGLASLRGPIDDYFEQVMVMCDDPALRANRLAQLAELRNMFLAVADISCVSVN